jgi:hypothetical protein
LAKRALFKKKSGVTSPVLSMKKGESEADAVARLKQAGWNPDKVAHHTCDGKSGSELHAGEQAECIVCSRRSNNTKEEKSPPKKEVTTKKEKKSDVNGKTKKS